MNSLEQRFRDTIVEVKDFPKKGIGFKDITPVFHNAQLCKDIVQAKSDFYRNKVDAICGIESRGFLFGFPIAIELGVPLILIRKVGKLPPPVLSTSYTLEYGEATIEIQSHYLHEGMKVLIHDDVLATGGTAVAAAQLVQQAGASVFGFDFLIELEFLKGRDLLQPYSSMIHSITSY